MMSASHPPTNHVATNHVAIVGMACRLPGASTPDAFWQRLLSGSDSFTDLAGDALIEAGVDGAILADPAYVRRAPLLDGVELFDPDFFKLSVEQAALLDPQHRLFFECAVEALAAAGHYPVPDGAGPVGIFAGCSISSYLLFNLLGGLNPGASPAALMAMIGNEKDYLPSRLAYLLGLSGPTVAVQTACSTSLTAVHMACQSLLSGECDLALAGGASVRVPHRVGYRFEDGSILSPTGRCRSFDAAADGTVFGSGVGVVALKRLDDALAAGDVIDGVILSSAINNDASRKAGFTAPSIDGQAEVIAEALALSGLAPADIGYIEAHGTATPIGDPIELRALAQVFPVAEVGQGRIGLGSAKATVGHLEAAAGVTGLIAAVQALKHATIPPVANFTSPNPALSLDQTAFAPAARPRPWPQGGSGPRRAGVSSFGIGGANAHVVLEQAPAIGPTRNRPPAPVFHRQRCWRDPQIIPDTGLPGRRIVTPLACGLFEARLTPTSPAWLGQHVVRGQVTLPGAAYGALAAEAALAVAAADKRSGDGMIRLGSLDILHPVTVPMAGVTLQTVLGADGGVQFHACVGAEGHWQHCASIAPAAATGDAGVRGDEAACTTSLPADDLYRRMASSGIALGPDFQRLSEIRAGGSEATASLRPGRPLTAVIDAMFQLLAALVPDGAGPCLPAGFDGLILSRHLLDDGGLGVNPQIHARLRPDGDGATGFVGDIHLTGSDARTLALVDGLICRPARAGAGAVDRHLYRPVWQPARLAGLASPTTAQSGMVSPRDLSAYPGYLARIDALASLYAAAALDRLGDGAVLPIYDRLLPRLHAMAAGAPANRDVASLLADIGRLYPEQAPETGMLARCGQALDLVLTGVADPLGLLFVASGDGAAEVYRESAYAGALNDLLSGALRSGLADGAESLRVLEIGGGTGGATRHLLPVLSGRLASYRFTDISPAFLAAAEAGFASEPGFETGLLDVDTDLAAQGIAAGSHDVVVASNALHVARDLRLAVRRVAGALRPGGWIVLAEGMGPSRWLDLTFALTTGWWHAMDRDLRPDYPLLDANGWTRLLQDEGFDEVVIVPPGEGQLADQAAIIARRAGPDTVVHICRDALVDRTAGASLPVERILAWLQSLPPGDGARSLALVLTRGAQQVERHERPDAEQATITGLVKAAVLERPDWRFRLVDLDPLASDEDIATAERAEQQAGDDEQEIAWRAGQRHALRLVREQADPLPDGFRLVAANTGSLDGLVMQGGFAVPVPASDQVVIRVEAAGLNFKDVLVTLGMVDAAPLGGECAGTVVAVGDGVAATTGGLRPGDRVMAVGGGCLADHVCVPALRAVRLPPGLGMVQAASLPVAGFTAWHAMAEIAHLCPGQRVLIHSATGAVGQFALSLALAAGCRVWATAGSATRRAFLRAQGVEAVAGSRDAGFATSLPADAGDPAARVDVVLNSLGGEAIGVSLALLKPGGCFIELGRVGVWSADRVATHRPDVRYHVVALDRIDDAEGGRLLQATVSALMEGRMALPPLSPWPIAQAADALQQMARARHMGKIVLTRPQPFAFATDRSLLITGGLGGVGLAVAEWAVGQGARALALVARRAPDAEACARIARLQGAGATVMVIQADVGQRAEVARVLAMIEQGLPPLSAVFHAAGVLADGALAAMTPASLAAVRAAKIDAARHLDVLTRQLPGGPIDAFVLFGSAAGLLGSPGQANHCAANSALDALAEQRRAEGLPAISIAWGAWSEVGAAAKRNVADRLAGSGMGSLTNVEGLAALARSLDSDAARLAVLPIDWPALTGHFNGTLPPLLRGLGDGPVAGPAPVPVPVMAGVDEDRTASLRITLDALPPDARVAALAERITVAAAALLTTGGKAISQDRPLNEMGLDSLLSVELRNRLARMTGCSLPATLLFNHPTIAALARHLVGLMTGNSTSVVVSSAEMLPMSANEADEEDFNAFLSAMEERYGS